MNPPPQLHFGPPAVHSDLHRRHSPRRSLASSLSDLGVKSLKSFSFPFFCLQAKSLSSKSFVFCNAHPLFSHFFTLAEISPLFTYSSQKHPGYTPWPTTKQELYFLSKSSATAQSQNPATCSPAPTAVSGACSSAIIPLSLAAQIQQREQTK